MSPKRWVLVIVLAWIATVTVLHMWLNWRIFDPPKRGKAAGPSFHVGYLPVT